MTQQIKVPLLPLQPVEERKNPCFVMHNDGRVDYCWWHRESDDGYPYDAWYSGGGIWRDDVIAGILPPFKVVDGNIVFEV